MAGSQIPTIRSTLPVISFEHHIYNNFHNSQLSRPKPPLHFSLFSSAVFSLHGYMHSILIFFSFILVLSLQTMPDLGNLSLSASLTLTTSPNFKLLTDSPEQSLVKNLGLDCDWDQRLRFATLHNAEVSTGAAIRVFRRSRPLVDRSKKISSGKSLEDNVREWVSNRVELGIPESRCSLPFLYGAKKLVNLLFVLNCCLVAGKMGEEK